MNVTRISGTYFTVNPMAVRTPVDVYTENVRTVTLIESTDFGKVVMVCVGAMMVGSIIMTKESGHVSRYVVFIPFVRLLCLNSMSRMEEHGYFAFGGSTILILFQKDRILFDRDLVENSDKCVETIVKVGNSIGMTESLSPTEDTAP